MTVGQLIEKLDEYTKADKPRILPLGIFRAYPAPNDSSLVVFEVDENVDLFKMAEVCFSVQHGERFITVEGEQVEFNDNTPAFFEEGSGVEKLNIYEIVDKYYTIEQFYDALVTIEDGTLEDIFVELMLNAKPQRMEKNFSPMNEFYKDIVADIEKIVYSNLDDRLKVWCVKKLIE